LGSKKHTAEEIIGKLRQVEVALAQGIVVPDVCRRLGVTGRSWQASTGDTAIGG
jgi:putative transposase